MNGADLIRTHHDELLALLVITIVEHVPGFNTGIEDSRHPLRRQRQRALELSLAGMADAIDALHGRDVEPMDWSEHIELGRLERRYQRPLSDILRAPWIASRTIVRFISDRAPGLDIPLAAAQEATEFVIGWSDQISIAFSEGYNDETAAKAGELETHRQHLLRILVADTPAEVDVIANAASAAEWRPPGTSRTLVCRGPGRHHYRREVPTGSLTADLDYELIALVPNQADLTSLTDAAIPDTVASLGPPVATSHAGQSARLARRAIDLADPETMSAGQIIDCTGRDLDLIALADTEAADDFGRRLLGPILQDRDLVATLDAWLSHQGRPKASARALGVHPNTVTYRINRARHHLGSTVDDPLRRLELHLATHIALRRQLSATTDR